MDAFIFGEKIQDGHFKDAVVDAAIKSTHTSDESTRQYVPRFARVDGPSLVSRKTAKIERKISSCKCIFLKLVAARICLLRDNALCFLRPTEKPYFRVKVLTLYQSFSTRLATSQYHKTLYQLWSDSSAKSGRV